jgi:hypothetical protein
MELTLRLAPIRVALGMCAFGTGPSVVRVAPAAGAGSRSAAPSPALGIELLLALRTRPVPA